MDLMILGVNRSVICEYWPWWQCHFYESSTRHHV